MVGRSGKRSIWASSDSTSNSTTVRKSPVRRTQFMKRLVEFVDRHRIVVELAYLPPYHSKYNPIERCWGILEQHWNGTLLHSVEHALRLGRHDDVADDSSSHPRDHHDLRTRRPANQDRVWPHRRTLDPLRNLAQMEPHHSAPVTGRFISRRCLTNTAQNSP